MAFFNAKSLPSDIDSFQSVSYENPGKTSKKFTLHLKEPSLNSVGSATHHFLYIVVTVTNKRITISTMLSALERPSAKSPMKGPVSPSTRCSPNFLPNNRTLCSQKTFTNPNYVNEFPSNMRPVDNSLHNYPNSCPKPKIGCETTPRLAAPPSGKLSEKEGEMGRGHKPLDPLLGKSITMNGQPSKEHPEVKEVPEEVQSSDTMDHNSPSCPPEASMNTFNSFEDLAFDWGNSPRNRSRKSSLTASEDSFVIFDHEGNEELTSEDDSSDEEPACSRRRLSVSESEDSFIMFDKGDVESMEDLSEEEDEDEDDDEDEEGADKNGSFDEVDFCRVTRKKVTFAANENLCTVYPMIKWSFAYQAARKGQWEMHARDRGRFKDRIVRAERSIKLVLDPKHRAKIYSERFINV